MSVVVAGDVLVQAACTGVLDFVNRAAGAAMGGRGLLGQTHWDPGTGPALTFDGAGRVSGATYTVQISIRRAVGQGSWDTNNTDAIHQVETLNRQHEHNHASDYTRVFNDNFGPDFMSSLVGMTRPAANAAIQAALRQLRTDMAAATAALDASEGRTQVDQNEDGSFTVAQVGR